MEVELGRTTYNCSAYFNFISKNVLERLRKSWSGQPSPARNKTGFFWNTKKVQ
jgi:hypothetical protein